MDNLNSTTATVSKPKLNTAMLLMQCLGIIAVVMGHADLGTTAIPNFLKYAFPYYSWHMPFFIFISGYFFNRTRPAGEYILQKLKKHLVPALIVNFVCGIFSMCLLNFKITNYGQPITFESLFILPFTTGYQFYVNIAMWFVFTLVVIEVLCCVMDRITRGKGDIFFLIITLAISLYCCSRAFYDHEGTREENYNAVLRLGFLLFFFWLGACYRKYGEKYLKRFINFKTSIVIFILQSMYVGLNGYVITTNVRNMRYNSINVPGGYWIPVVTAITGTLFFLGICYSLAPYFEKSRFLVTFGTNTKYVMYYHQLIFVLSSVLIAVLTKLEKLTLPGFNYDVMVNKQYYTGGNPTLTVVVALLAIILPVVVCSSINKLKPLWRYIIYAAITGVIVLFLYFAGRVLN